MNCPECGNAIEDGSKFCDECGAAIPQSKECPKCHAQLKPNAKFCSECGYSFSGKTATGVASMIGDKNVIAGDVTLTQTIVNQDETKKVVECCVCKRPVAITKSFVCADCGCNVCKAHYDAEHKLCSSCLDKKNAAAEAEYRALLSKVLEDGIIVKSEFKELESLRTKLGLSQTRAKELLDEARDAVSKLAQALKNDTLSEVEQDELDDAHDSLFEEENARRAIELLSKIYAQHPQNEQILEVYLPALAMIDSEKAKSTIAQLDVDYKCAYLTLFDIFMRAGDLIAAEEQLLRLEELWPDDCLVKCRRAELLCAKGDLNSAEQIVLGMEDSDEKMELSWQYYIKHLVSEGLGDDLPFDMNDYYPECYEGGDDRFYNAVLAGAIGGYIDIGYRKVLIEIPNGEFMSPNRVELPLPRIRALKFLSDGGNPFAKLKLADCCVFGNGEAKFGCVKLYEEALKILEKFDAEPGDDVPVKVKLGTWEERINLGYYQSYAAIMLAICYKKGIRCERNSYDADYYWDKFKEDYQSLFEIFSEKYGSDSSRWPVRDIHKSSLSDFEFENFVA